MAGRGARLKPAMPLGPLFGGADGAGGLNLP
jgi:hypothetical protein